MGRHVEHSVSGHDAVFARAAGPIVRDVLAAGQADELGASVRGDNVVLAGFAGMTAGVMPGTVKVFGIDHGALFTGGQVEAGDMLVVIRHDPDLALGNKHTSRHVLPVGPKKLARLNRQDLKIRAEHHVVAVSQHRSWFNRRTFPQRRAIL